MSRDLDELEELVSKLVAIESVNPDLAPTGSGETAIAGFVSSWLKDAGLDVSVVDPAGGRPSVVGIARGTGGGRSLMLNAHMDTVGAGAMEAPFSPRVEAGRLYGRGAYDMKASLAAIMLAARRARAMNLKGDVIVAAVADEEVASIGTSAVLDHVHPDAAIVAEPTEQQLCVAHKGFVWLEVETAGVAAHGSRADLGVDAIAEMGSVLTQITQLAGQLRARPQHPLLGTGSIHASLIEGGQEMSTYPARCVVKIERRTLPGESGETCRQELAGVIGGQKATTKVLLERASSELARDHPLSQAVAEAAGGPATIGVAYWMDMALLNAAGVPAVAFGPSGEGAHADVEWVDLASVQRCVEVYARTAELLC